MQIWVIYGILLVIECCGTLGTAVNEAYFALFSMGAHGTGTRGGGGNSLYFVWYRRAAGIAPILQVIYT